MSEGAHSNMTQERLEKLGSIGFEWNKWKDTWNERYEELKDFKDQQGHCNVPHKYQPNKALGNWVQKQRQNYKLMLEGSKSGRMTEERVEKLENIGFEWNKKDIWDMRLEELKLFKAQHGNCNVPMRRNKVLGQWVITQRKNYKRMLEGSKSYMTEERVEKLENIGFEWTINKYVQKYTWDERLGQLKRYKAQNGHCNVSMRDDRNKGLGIWVGTQRTEYKHMLEGSKSALTEERVEKLENIGFEWTIKGYVQKCTWDERLQQLKKFKAQYGHCNVPADYESNKSLGQWVSNQRQKYKLLLQGSKSALTEERVEKLESLGFEWRILKKKRNARKNATVKRSNKRVRSRK